MPTISVNSDLKYFYNDSGAPSTPNYKTLVLIHGHTFHSGTFQRLLPIASSKGLRIIGVNRRGYPGTTDFSPNELTTLNSGSDEARYALLEKQGSDIALFLCALIKECSISKEGGLYVSGWSLGNTFLLSFVAGVQDFLVDVKVVLNIYLKGVIMWDAPTHSLGNTGNAPNYFPLFDEELSPAARGQAFGIWGSSYWKHPDPTSRDLSKLSDRTPDPARKSTLNNMTQEELFSMADFTVGDKFENIIISPVFEPVLLKNTEKALFDPEIRKAWKGVEFVHVFGNSNVWCIHLAEWILRDRVANAKDSDLAIRFEVIEGGNHLSMWDDPEATLTVLTSCVTSE